MAGRKGQAARQTAAGQRFRQRSRACHAVPFHPRSTDHVALRCGTGRNDDSVATDSLPHTPSTHMTADVITHPLADVSTGVTAAASEASAVTARATPVICIAIHRFWDSLGCRTKFVKICIVKDINITNG